MEQLKLRESDKAAVIALLKAGNTYKDICNSLCVSGPTLRKFMLEYDLYKYSTNNKSLKISQFKSGKGNTDSNINTIGSCTNIQEVFDSKDDLYNEDVNYLEKLLKEGTSIAQIGRIYNKDRGIVREYLKKIGLYEKYCSGNKFDNGAKKRYLEKLSKVKEEVKTTLPPDTNNEEYTPSGLSMGIEKIIKDETITNNTTNTSPTLNEATDISSPENKKEITSIMSVINQLNCPGGEILADYINSNFAELHLKARLEDMNNTLMDKIISNFSEEELKDGNIKSKIKESLIKLVEDLL